MTPQLYGMRAAKASSLVVERVPGGLFESYAQHFEAVWTGAVGVGGSSLKG